MRCPHGDRRKRKHLDGAGRVVWLCTDCAPDLARDPERAAPSDTTRAPKTTPAPARKDEDRKPQHPPPKGRGRARQVTPEAAMLLARVQALGVEVERHRQEMVRLGRERGLLLDQVRDLGIGTQAIAAHLGMEPISVKKLIQRAKRGEGRPEGL